MMFKMTHVGTIFKDSFNFGNKAGDPTHLFDSHYGIEFMIELCHQETQTMIQWISWLLYSKGNRIVCFEYDNFITGMVKCCVVTQPLLNCKVLIFRKFQNAENFADCCEIFYQLRTWASGPLECWYLRLKLFNWLPLKRLKLRIQWTELKQSASPWWSFGPNSAWGSIEPMPIGKHPSLVPSEWFSIYISFRMIPNESRVLFDQLYFAVTVLYSVVCIVRNVLT